MTPYASFYLKVFTPSFTLVVAVIVTPYASFYLKVFTPSFTLIWWWRSYRAVTIDIILLEGFQVFISNDVVFMVEEGWGGGGGGLRYTL